MKQNKLQFDSMFNFFKPQKDQTNQTNKKETPRSKSPGKSNEAWLVDNVKKSVNSKLSQQSRIHLWNQISSPYDALPVQSAGHGPNNGTKDQDLFELVEEEAASGEFESFIQALQGGDNEEAAEFIRKLHRKIFKRESMDESKVSDDEILSLVEESLRALNFSIIDVKQILPDLLFRLFILCSSRVMTEIENEDAEISTLDDSGFSDVKDQEDTHDIKQSRICSTRLGAKTSPSPTGGVHRGPRAPKGARAKGPIQRDPKSSLPNPLSRGASPEYRKRMQNHFFEEEKSLNERLAKAQRNSQETKPKEKEEEVPSGPNELHRLVFDNDLAGLQRLFLDGPVKGLEAKDGRDNTPLLLAVRLGYVEIAEFLVHQGAKVDMKSSDPHFHLLDETILTKNRRLIRIVYRQLQVITWRKWMARVPKLMEVLEDIQDFSVEMKWNFESNAILSPLVRAVAPSDTYKIWKKGSWLRVDSTIAGFARGFKIRRGDMSLVFQGRGAPYPGDLLRINHQKSKVSRVFRRVENPTHLEVERAVSRLIHSTSKQLTATQLSTSEFEFRKATGRRSTDNISGYNTELYEGIGDVRLINHKKGENDYAFAAAEEYFDPHFNLDGIALQRMDTTNEEEEESSKLFQWGKKKISKQRNVASSKQRLHVKMKTQLWMAEKYPLKLQHILPALEILSTKDKLITKLNDLLSSEQIPPGHFPVKTKLPLILGIHALVVFENFSTEPVEDSMFSIPDGYFVRDPLAPLVDSDDDTTLSDISQVETKSP